ncbi:hypothetical protein FRC03_000122 [Tulasnella sp. 419]|nr:hypothetical protein FRC03_000122 [Tulasnella sp. 419]
MASNRFAPHLETCLGLNTNVRRAGARTAAVKTKIGSEGSRSNSPTVVVTDDAPAPPPARKGRPPKNGTPKNSKKKGMPPPTTPELNGNNKRPLSPNPTPPKNNKKQKNAVTSPSPSLKGLPLATSAPGSSVKSTHPKIPSRLRASSTSSFITPSLVASSPGNEESIYSVEGSPSRDGSPDSISPFLTPNSKSKSQKTRPGMPAKGVAGKTPPVTYTPPRPPPAPVTRPDDDVVGMDADDLVETASSEED